MSAVVMIAVLVVLAFLCMASSIGGYSGKRLL